MGFEDWQPPAKHKNPRWSSLLNHAVLIRQDMREQAKAEKEKRHALDAKAAPPLPGGGA